MKHILVTVVAFLLSTGLVQAQHINLGIKGGLNAYTITGDSHSGFDQKLSYNLGLFGHIHINSKFALQPEITYSEQGTTYKIGSVDNSLKLNYVNIPLNLQYMFDNGFRIQAGPQLGILTSANLKTGDFVADQKASYKSTDVSLTVGVSYIDTSTGFGIDLRYNHGLTNINSTEVIQSYNRGLQLGLFYLFGHRS